MAASLYRVTSLFFLALALVALAVETAHGADKRGTKEKVKLKDYVEGQEAKEKVKLKDYMEGQEAKEKLKLKDYLEGQEADAKPPPQNASPLEVYLHLLRLKRREQIATADKVLSIPDYSRQYKTITMLLDALFPEIQESMKRLEKTEYSAGMPFPEDRETQELVSKVYENVLMFGDFLLRMPDITKKVYNQKKEWTGVFRWAIKFCSASTDVFTGPHAMQLELMMQEMGIGPKDPNYINPFSQGENMRGKTEEDIMKERAKIRREALQEKMNNMKGPRLRTNRHNEL